MHLTGHTILIVGGTSGIGLELALRLRDAGNSIIISGRRTERLAAIEAEHGIPGIAADVADAGSIRNLRDTAIERFPALDTVVTMSGIMQRELVLEPGALEIAERTIETNLLGTIRLVEAFLPHLLSRPRAAILTVSSGLAFVPRADTPTYSATKAAVHSYTESLREQLRDTSVQVIELVPPLTATELTPGQLENPAAMPLVEYVAESIALLDADPDITEVLVERVKPQRFAEVDGTYAQIFARIAGRAV
ncbi:SDR family oxidoreductase [Leucobacter musarum]|uniref:SDR family oxidoreductase n=1 Tax=Leucobacter musarum TaxID=1930747 RepID=UPI0006A7B50C|nr:SDR family NAD(P)-dependent oxidoreductase [Leucobacter musarum]